MLPLSLCVWCVVFFFPFISSENVIIEEVACDLEDEEVFDSLCTLGKEHKDCVLQCLLHVPGEEEPRVGEGSVCYDKQLQALACFQSLWVPAGQAPRRRKRWWFWASKKSASAPQYYPSIQCPGDVFVTAPPGKMTAVATWQPATASDGNGDSPTVTQTQGPVSGSAFPQGTTPIGYKAVDNTGRTATCTFSVNVNVIYCPDQQRRAFQSPGTQTCTGGEAKNIYGSRCIHSCPTGYTLQGSAFVYCRSNGYWDSSFPRCQIVSCGNPADVAGGKVSCPYGHTYGRQCVLQCLNRYSMTGESTITCYSSGLWNPTLKPCTDKEPPTFPNGCPVDQSLFSGPLQSPVNVTWADPNVTDNSPYPVTLTSDPAKGSSLGVGEHTVTVTAVDRVGNSRSCSFVVNIFAKQCSVLPPPAYGNVTCTGGDVEGSRCTFGCSPGYKVQGHSSLTCLGSKLWDRTPPTCEAVLCPAPPQVEKGSFMCPQGHHFPAVCNLTCDFGYTVTGETTLRCQENQTWTPHGSCRDTQPPRFVRSCPSDFHPYAPRLGNDTLIFWPPLNASDNSGSAVHVTCDAASGSVFPPGATTVTCTATDTAGNSRSCKFSVNVTVLRCPNPGTSLNNQSELLYTCPDGHVHGANCTLGCTYGHSLLGEDKIVCERDPNTNPPVMRWKGTKGELSSKPECKVDKCPRLEPPVNGSLSCLRGPVGQDCFIQCHSDRDVSANHLRFGGHFFCNGRDGSWRPSRVPDCVVLKVPWRIKVKSSLFYLTDACNGSEPIVRENFITRLRSSPILRDACAVPTCIPRNVKVTCGPITRTRDRPRRAVDQWFNPQLLKKRGGKGSRVATHQVVVSFEVVLSDLMTNSSLSHTELYKAVQQTKASLTHSLIVQAASGRLALTRPLQADLSRLTRPALHVHCPPGTLLRPPHLSSGRFSCVGCSKGHYLSPGTKQCEQCPRGQFSPLDSATYCRPCPRGTTTPSAGADDVSLCQPGDPGV